MKRSYPSSPNSSDESDTFKPTNTPENQDIKPQIHDSSPASSPTKKARKSNSQFSPSTPTKTKTQNSSHSITPSPGSANGPWTPDKREKLLEKIFTAGLKNLNLDEICEEEFGLTRLQLKNATQTGRKGNLRDKACKAIRGD